MNFLPGWFPSGGVTGVVIPPDLTSITQVLSATSTAATITFPGGIQAGDLIVMLDQARHSLGSPTTVVPSGFTSISNLAILDAAADFFLKQIASYKLALGTESGSLTGMTADNALNKAMYVFRGNTPATVLTLSGGVGGQATTGDPTAQTVLSSSGTPPLVVFGGYGSDGSITARTFTVSGVGAKDGEINPSVNLFLAYKIYNASPANVVIDMGDTGTQMLQSFYIQMAE